jgi:ELWxxDGT repeat protein
MTFIRIFVILFISGRIFADPLPFRVTNFRTEYDPHPRLSRSVEMGSSLYFVKESNFLDFRYGTLYRTDGSASGTTAVVGSTPYTNDVQLVIDEFSHRLAVCGDQLYFAGLAENGAKRLYRIGEAESQPTVMWNVFEPRYLTTVGTHVYFSAMDYTFYTSLWKTDGTTAGTVKITNTALGPNPLPTSLRELNGKLYFHSGGRLFQSDGTNGGTITVKTPFSYDYLLSFNDELYFKTSWALYKSIGPAIEPVQFLNGEIRMASPLGSHLIILSSNPSNPFTLWKSDGTYEGTTKITDFNGTGYDNSTSVSFISELGGFLYFGITNESETLKLWKTDGTSEGTVEVWDSPDARQGVRASIVHRDRMYLSVLKDDSHPELWSSDGTSAGTRLIGGTDAREFRPAGSLLYFFAGNLDTQGDELFALDDIPAARPEAIGTITGIGRFNADFSLIIDPNRSTTTAAIHYGLTPDYGQRHEISFSPSNGTLPEAATASLSGLTHGTRYHYKVTAVNSAGETSTEDGTFTTTANLAPSLSPMEHLIYDNSVFSFTEAGILSRAKDPESDPLTVSLGSPAAGSTILRQDGLFHYTPPSGFVGKDLFPFTVTDSFGATTESIMTIHVAGDFGHPWLGGGPTIYRGEEMGFDSSQTYFVSSANPGQSYIIQRSTDLKTWINIGTEIGGYTGLVGFMDETSPADKAFYRLAKPPFSP